MEWVLFDYGVGNLHSLQKALDRVGAQTTVTQDPARLVEADIAVLPGVGAFGHVMDALGPAVDDLRARHEAGRPILGVCIGMQVLYEGSAETPGREGLGILSGSVDHLPATAGKVPHMGWNTIEASTGPLVGLDGRHVYYVHSFAAPPGPSTVATTEYGMSFSAAVQQDNTLGFQFHPEKSSGVGQELLAWARSRLEEVG